MRVNILFFFLILFISNVYSQTNETVIFGKPNSVEVLANKCILDSSAEAELLYDNERIEFFVDQNGHYNLKTIYHGRLKIYKKSGLDRGTIKITLKNNDTYKQIIENIKGYTYNQENGVLVISELKSNSIFHEKINDNKSVTKIIAPNLKEGSVFDYTYSYTTPFQISYKPNTWYFQGEIPYKYSDISIIIPGRFHYKLFYHGYIPLNLKETKDTIISFNENNVNAIKYRFIAKDVPALSNEPFMTSFKDYISKLEFELASYLPPNSNTEIKYTESWDDINKSLLEDGNFGAKLNNTGFLKDLAEKFESIVDTNEKIDAAFRYIAKNLKWDGYSNLYSDQNLKKIFEKKLGSNVEINMILVALLRKMNIDANLAILNIYDNSEINDSFPQLNKFNYTISQAKVGGKDIIMDATDQFSKPNMLPYDRASKKILIIEKAHGRLINFQTKEKKRQMESIDYIIIPDSNKINAKYTSTFGGYSAYNLRNYLFDSNENDYYKNLKKLNPNWQIENPIIENKDSVFEPINLKYNFTTTYYPQTTDQIIFNPFFDHRYTANPFKQTTRIYPIDLNVPSDDITLIKIKIPVGYKIEELPTTGIYMLPNKTGKFSYVVEIDNDIIKIRSQITINKNIFETNEYQGLKELFNLIINKQAQQIVLKKNN